MHIQLQKLAHLLQTSKIPEAMALGEQLAVSFPHDRDLLTLMGAVYGSAGRFPEAETCYKELITIEATSPLHYYYLGLSLVMQERLDEAVVPFDKMLQLDPDFAEGHMQAGCLYRDLGNPTQALHHLHKAVGLSPSLHDATVILANLLIFQDRMDEAMEFYDQVLSKNPVHPDALAGKASVFEKQGHVEASWEHISQAIRNGTVTPNSAIIYAKLAPKYDCIEHANSLLAELLSNHSLAPSQQQEINFALGELNDTAGNFDTAFKYFKNANSLSQLRSNVISMTRRMQDIVGVFSGKSIPSANKSAGFSPTPIFIVGMPRSGSSLVEQILGCHPDVTAAGELSALHQVEIVIPEITGNQANYPACLQFASADNMNTLADLYIKTITEISGGSRFVTDKLPTNFERLGLIEKLFPDARIIHTTRHPLDTCLSCYFQNFGNSHIYSSDLHDLAIAYKNYEKLMAYWEDTLSISIHEVNYESIVNNPEQVVRELLAYCRLPWNPHCLDFHKSRRYIHTASYNQVRQPIYRGSVGRWKNYEPYIGELIDHLQQESL